MLLSLSRALWTQPRRLQRPWGCFLLRALVRKAKVVLLLQAELAQVTSPGPAEPLTLLRAPWGGLHPHGREPGWGWCLGHPGQAWQWVASSSGGPGEGDWPSLSSERCLAQAKCTTRVTSLDLVPRRRLRLSQGEWFAHIPQLARD